MMKPESESNSSRGELTLEPAHKKAWEVVFKKLSQQLSCELTQPNRQLLALASEQNSKDLFDRCTQLRRFLLLHQSPQQCLPPLTDLRLIVMSGQVDGLVAYCQQNKVELKDLLATDPDLLYFAAIGGNTSIIDDLIAAGANPNASDNLGMTPMMYAALMGHEAAVTHLITTHQVYVQHKDNMGRTAYHCAAFAYNQQLMSNLAAAGLDDNALDDYNTTVGHYIAWGGTSAGKSALATYQYKGDPNPVTTDSISLYDAQIVGGMQLIPHDADVSKPSNLHDNVLLGRFMAVPLVSYAYFELKRKGFFNYYQHNLKAMMKAATYGNLDVFEHLMHYAIQTASPTGSLNQEKCVMLKDGFLDRTPLHYFAISQSLGGVQYCYDALSNKSKFFTTADKDGSTIIHAAALGGNIVLMQWCLQQADQPEEVIAKTNSKGESALHYAARSNNPAMVDLCIEHGLSVDATDRDGLTPLDHAISQGSLPVVLALMNHRAVLKNPDRVIHNPDPKVIHWVLQQTGQLPLSAERYHQLAHDMLEANNHAGTHYLRRLQDVETSMQYFNNVLVSSSQADVIDRDVLASILEDIDNHLHHQMPLAHQTIERCDQLIQSLPNPTGGKFSTGRSSREYHKIETIKEHLIKLKGVTELNIQMNSPTVKLDAKLEYGKN